MRQQRPRRVIHRRSAEREQRRGTEIETIREPLLLFYQKLVQCCEWEVGGGERTREEKGVVTRYSRGRDGVAAALAKEEITERDI